MAPRLQQMALQLAARRGARVELEGPVVDVNITGQAVMGVTFGERCSTARLMAEKSEDIYRILHYCLSPLAHHLGVEPYADRVHGMAPYALTSEPVETTASPQKPANMTPVDVALDLRSTMVLCQLTDATLPVGGFAHSNGMEAASQLGLFGKNVQLEPLRMMVFQGSRSMLRLQGHFVKLAYKLGDQDGDSAVSHHGAGTLFPFFLFMFQASFPK